MNKKLIYFVAVVSVFIVTIFAAASEKEDTKWIHQHQESKGNELPVVKIDTNGQKIPGLIREKDRIKAEVELLDTDTQKLTKTTSLIKYRGNTSLHFDKHSYLLDFVQEDDSENQIPVFGMPKHEEWILNGPFLDKTLMRNYLCMNISAEIMGYAPRVRYCEVYLNGKYQGVYLMMEKVSRGINRINIPAYKEGDPYTSYILRADRGDTEQTDLNNFLKYSLKMNKDIRGTKHYINVEYPSKNLLTDELKEYIEQDLSKMEKAIYSYDYDSDKYGYKDCLDVKSFVDYFIINEFFQNYDAGIFSTYYYKDVRGKLFIGPVWDFNNACDNYMDEVHNGIEFEITRRPWFGMLVKDEDFVESVILRYRELRKTYLNEDYLMNYIDDTRAYLGDSIERNYSVWGYSFQAENLDIMERLLPLERNVKDYDEAILQLKTFIQKRGKWLDNNIQVLNQYCHESKVKKFNH